MQLCKARLEDGSIRVGVVQQGTVRFLDLEDPRGARTLSDVLHADDPLRLARTLFDPEAEPVALERLSLFAPVDHQDIWAAGVTYLRSKDARERESVGAAQFYDKVYTAARPELFFKATATRAVGPDHPVRVRRDSRWTVPEPELALLLSPNFKVVGYTIGNDMSARDIEGENPLYLPQAKLYDQSCALGPVVTLADAMPPTDKVTIRLVIERHGTTIFDGSTPLSRMARTFSDLVNWLGREISFPHGGVLLTGTGVVPPDDFSLQTDDIVHIDITGIGRLTNPVQTAASSV